MFSLLVDIGNSRLKWATSRQNLFSVGNPVGDVGQVPCFATAWSGLDPPNRVLVSNVRGLRTADAMSQWVMDKWGLSADFVRSVGHAFGVRNAYRNPGQLGVDRWLCLVAVRSLFREPVCIVDCGTAITVDVMDREGQHRGGVICPGLALMQDSLLRGTSDLSFDAVDQTGLLGRDTGAGIYGGTIAAATGMVEKVVQEAEQSLAGPLRIVVTGGGSERLTRHLGRTYEVIPDLVLKGLLVVDTRQDPESA